MSDYIPNDLRADKELKVGDRVFCTVSALKGWVIVVDIKGSGDKLRVRTDATSGWGYGHNFTKNPPEWMTK